MTNYARDKDFILKQLAMAKETLTKLRALTDPKNTTESQFNGHNGSFSGMERVDGWDDYRHDSDDRSSGLGMESPHYDSRVQGTNLASDKSMAARNSLAKVLGLQVSQLEDDLKASLLAYFEQMEEQKEELITSFETMHAQLSKHHEICQEHYKETAEKDLCIERLKVDKQTLEMDVEKLRRENMQLKSARGRTRENGYRLSPGYVEHDELSETLMKENSRLREMLRKYESNDCARLERKVGLQEKLCESYKKDVMSKDSLLKRLKAENRGLHEDVKNLQDEILRVNANRLNAEHDKTRLQQELQFSEEQISSLREKVSSSADESRYLQRCISDASSKANISGGNLSELEKETLALRGKCESYRDKLNDKERFLASVTKENEGLKRAVEAMTRELAAVRGEERSLKIENERLQGENADREIDLLSSETATEVNGNKISKMKQQVRDLQSTVRDMELQRQEHEDRENELSQEVLANLEKYTQVEQQLYLTKKELAQLQGFYDSSEEKRRDLQAEAENCRQRIVSLEKQLKERQMDEAGEKSVSDVIKENEGLNEENQRLREEYEMSKIEIAELEEALQSAREQNSLQRMRLDAHDTLMKRKDERIKELQNELAELHNQMETLTDEILKKNREMEGLRMSKRLLDQELGLLKSGKLAAKTLYREGMTKDNSPFYHTTDPASPDSGFSDTERERAIDRLRREILSHPQHPVLYEEEFAPNEEEKSHADLALAASRLKETEKRLAEVIAENENLKDQEHEARNLQLQMDEQLRKVIEENKELKEKEKMLLQALEENQRFVTQNESAETLESPLKVEDLFAIDEPLVEKTILQPVLETIPENAADCLENEPEERLINFLDEPDGLNSRPPQDEMTQIQNKNEALERQLQDYETNLAKLSADNEQLLSELTQTRESLKKLQNEGKAVQENRKELQNKTDELEEKIQDYETRLAKVNAENDKLLSELAHTRENLEEVTKDGKAVQKTKKALEDKTQELEEKILHYEKNLGKMNSENKQLLAELAHTQENLSVMERECKAEQDNRVELQKIMQEELAAKDDEVAKLQKELSVICEERERLESIVNSSRETSSHAEEQSLRAQNIILDLEKQRNSLHAKEKSLQHLLHQSEESNASLQVQLGVTEQAYRKMEKEAKALRQQIQLAQEESAEVQREVVELKENVAVKEQKRKKADESLQDLQTRNESLRQQLQDAEDALEKSHQENERTVLQLEEAIREKENDIEELHEELSLSEQRYTEIKSLSSNNQTEMSNVQAELIESKEQFYTVSQEKARLVHDKKELEHDIGEKDEKIAALEKEKSEQKRTISEQNEKVEELVDKLEEYENEATKLSQENISLRESLEQVANNKRELEHLLAESNEEKKALEQQLLAAHESITDLETAFERGEDKNSQTEENLREAKEQITKLQTQLEARQSEYRALERDYNETEKELEKAQETLDSFQGKIATLEKKLRDAEENISDLEMARDNGLSNEQLLQQRFANARENIEKTEAENEELKEKLTKLERKMTDAVSKQGALEDKKDELNKVNKELRKELDYERDKRLALKQKVESKDKENDVIQRKVQLLEKNMAEHEDLQNKGMEEKAKLREELARAKKNLSELETTKENQEESIHEMEEMLRETRGKIATLEQNLEDSVRDNADLHEELEELNRKLKYTKEENSELEKNLQKQKEVSDGLKSNLADREDSVMNSNYNRDIAERSLQSMKKELARKDAKLKMQKEQIEDMEGETEKSSKKLKETESSKKKLSSENERLLKELADTKAKLAKLQAMFKERRDAVSESDVPVVRVSEVQSDPIKSEKLIRDWSDKLSTAQIKVTDLENELLREIKKHEARVHRTRPVSHDLRRRSADNVLTDHTRPSRFRSRQRPNTSRDSSVDSLRSTQSMLDYLDERIVDEKFLSTGSPVASGTSVQVASEPGTPVPSETANPVPSETSTPVAAGNGSPVDSETEGESGLPVMTTDGAKPETRGTSKDREFTKQDEKRRETSERKPSSAGNDENPVDWKLEELLKPRIDNQQPLFTETQPLFSGRTNSPNKAEELGDIRIENLLELQIDYNRPVLIEDPEKRLNVTTEAFPDLQDNYQQSQLDEPHSGAQTSSEKVEDLVDPRTPDLQGIYQQPTSSTGIVPDIYQKSSSPDKEENLAHARSTDLMRIYQQPTEAVTDLQNIPQNQSFPDRPEHLFDIKSEEVPAFQSDYQQPLLIEPPADDLFQFESLPSDNSSSLTNVTDLTFHSPSPVFPEHMLLVTIDPKSAPEPQPYDKDDEEMLDPFEQLMRDAQRGESTEFDINDIDDVIIDVTDDVVTHDGDVSRNLVYETNERNNESHTKSEPMSITDIDHVTDGISIDVTDSPQTETVPHDRKRTTPTSNLGYGSPQPMNASSIDHVTDEAGLDVTDSQDRSHIDVIGQPIPLEPVPPPRKLKEKMTPVLFPRGDRKKSKENEGKRNVKSDTQPYSVMIMDDDEIDTQPYSVMIMDDDEIVQTSSPERLINPADRAKKKPKRPPKPAVPPAFSDAEGDVYKTPSQIRKELEDENVQTILEKSLNPAEGKERPTRPPRPVLPEAFANTADEETYKTPSQIRKELEENKNSNRGDRGKKKPQRPPKPAVPAAFATDEDEDTYKSPSQIRKELEEASKRGQRTVIAAKPMGKQQKPLVSGNRSSQYHIEEKGRESGVSGVDHAQGTEEGEQEEEMGIGRLLKLIAAFENN